MSACDLRRTCRPNPGLASLYLNTMYSVLRVVDKVSNFFATRHELDGFITNSPDFSYCTVAKSCLNTDHQALLVNCSAPSAKDSRKTR